MRIVILFLITLFLWTSYCQAEQWIATAYCPCKACCGKSDGITASGVKAKQGITCAINWLPFGTLVSVDGETYIVEDRGARSDFGDKKHHNKHVDIFFNKHSDAKKFGRRVVEVEVLS
jgi:3D (Asp-Asp-Asp) domain-containing protein